MAQRRGGPAPLRLQVKEDKIIAFLLGLTLAAASLDWLAVFNSWRKVEYAAKPAVMAFLFAWLAVTSHFTAVPPAWFGAGLVFSLVGDTFLMFSDRWFVLGLASFLMAQLMYVAGFNIPLPNVPPIWGFGLAVVLGLGSARVLGRITESLGTKGMRRLVGPVMLYGMIITLMLLSALLTIFRPEWSVLASLSVCIGAFLFYLSDVVLAWNRFVHPIRNGRLVNMVLYHLGQIALIVGVVSRFSPYFH